ncbi:hypothetical protein PENSPDRAFT_602548 [Peniophora sp. CONT]|nr:hypothetical protein PENSPDRAFT_602548 [Peniophora sp. CONT]
MPSDLKTHYDPRIGDEGEDESPPSQSRPAPPQIQVPGSPPEPGSSSTSASNEKLKHATGKAKPRVIRPQGEEPQWQKVARAVISKLPLVNNLGWVKANFVFSKLKPVIRSSVAAWVAVVLLVVNPVLRTMGQAGFLIVIASFLSPPSDPTIANIEREIVIVLIVLVSWAWSSLGVKLASLARSHIILTPDVQLVQQGAYVEAAPSIILAVFLFVGSSVFLYIKARKGPGPFLFATVLGCICLDITMQTAVLYPFPLYSIGQSVTLPLVFQAAIAIACSILIFPISISAQFVVRLRGVLNPLHDAMLEHINVLSTPTTSPDFSPAKARQLVNGAEGALAPLAMSARLLPRDIVWHRFSGPDLAVFRERMGRMTVAAGGMNHYFALIDPTRERFPVTPAPSQPATPILSPTQSRAASPTRTEHRTNDGHESPIIEGKAYVSPSNDRPSNPRHDSEQTPGATPPHSGGTDSHSDFPAFLEFSKKRGRRRHPHFEMDPITPTSSRAPSVRTGRHSNRHSLAAALHLPALHHREHVVGVFESQRYLDLENTHWNHPFAARFTERATELLHESVRDVLENAGGGLKALDKWLETSRKHKYAFWRCRQDMKRIQAEREAGLRAAIDALNASLDDFRKSRRFRVLEPYREAFDPKHLGSMTGDNVPPHRFLFHCYLYQYHLRRFCMRLNETLELALELETKRTKTRLWWADSALWKIWKWSIWDLHSNDEREDDENPDVIQGADTNNDLGEAMWRDPDAMPPSNWFERIMAALYHGARSLGGANVLFALKAGILTVVLSIPSLLKSTAGFAYAERFSWAVFMGQLTLARFRGDTSFGLVARIVSTFFGGLVGTAMWYISTGDGRGNSYGLAAVCAVCFPFFFFGRLYWPGPPMSNIIFFVTIVLIIGFSWQNTHFIAGSFSAYGINLAWRRFLLVTCGVVAAFIFSLLPPSATLRAYQRRTYATTISEIGGAYCAIVSFANSRGSHENTREIMQRLVAIRLKLKRSMFLKTNIVYEFSLRGKWPTKRYQKVLEIQIEISNLLSHLLSVVEHLEPVWSRAFLRRTRFLDADFQGDVLAVISLISTALRTGAPLPQITPCPLLERFIVHGHGLNVIRHEQDDDYGLPRTMTIDTLENEQYSVFCVGVSTAFGIVNRLDRLMVATKELVGEQYHIHGVGFVQKMGGVDMASRTNSLRPGHDV